MDEREELIARADKYLNTGSGEYASEIMRDMADYIRRAPSDPAQQPLSTLREALEPCKVEHKKFEEWAVTQHYDMHEHPLHYLFLDTKTYAARMGWKAALEYVTQTLASTPSTPPVQCARCAALDDSQSLLTTLLHLGQEYRGHLGSCPSGITATEWDSEGLTKLLTEQISENRTALSSTDGGGK